MMGDGVDRLKENSAGWANDVNKFVSKQKKGLMMGGEFCTALLVAFCDLLRINYSLTWTSAVKRGLGF